jgi:hypothetical protein
VCVPTERKDAFVNLPPFHKGHRPDEEEERIKRGIGCAEEVEDGP